MAGKESFGFKNYSMLARYTAQAMMYDHKQEHNFSLPKWKILPLREEGQNYALAQADCLPHCATACAIAIRENLITINLVNRIVYVKDHGLPPGNYFLSSEKPGEVLPEEKISDNCWRQKVFQVIDDEKILTTLKEPMPPRNNFAQIFNAGQTDLNSRVTGTQIIFDPSSVVGNKDLFIPSSKGLQVTTKGIVQAVAIHYATNTGGSGKKVIEICLTKNELLSVSAGVNNLSRTGELSIGYVSDPIRVENGDIVGVCAFLKGQSGAVNTIKGKSNLCVSLMSF